MTTLGFDKPLYILPFDHRGSFRPQLMAQAIEELQDAGVEADVWKIEGLDRREDCERIKALGKLAGVAINPATPANVLEEMAVQQ
jgi:pentose-5-phosphate-3-epimerase